ncbi:hypothetical protein A2G24_01090 [Listeria monocytogenes]|uniref:DUF7448 domain-containing protein n=1 Tax=Listeria monocytogenes TaxID=1639 RepID=A0A823DL03_LISMN|nr:hypothetical protein [Listeria monocytogenes]EAD1012222.1 hypothetical protein [Listeria monocytogenes]EAD1186129.1 hypothetical protein [Listeria monocytogenes]EAF8898047.1 hypothetical protein [Listeria monocytogenes]EDN8810071.1 hypothetical protein [Listeria monocytogenes]
MWREDYGKFEDLEKQILYKRVVEWDEDKLVLDDGTVITIECSEQDCCASAGGTFKNVELDAVITSASQGSTNSETSEYGYTCNEVMINIYHNQNVIAQADCYADNGNGGYYYSVGSLVVKGVHYPVVEAK